MLLALLQQVCIRTRSSGRKALTATCCLCSQAEADAPAGPQTHSEAREARAQTHAASDSQADAQTRAEADAQTDAAAGRRACADQPAAGHAGAPSADSSASQRSADTRRAEHSPARHSARSGPCPNSAAARSPAHRGADQVLGVQRQNMQLSALSRPKASMDMHLTLNYPLHG